MPGKSPRRMALPSLAREGPPRRAVIELYARAQARWADASQVLAQGLRETRALHSSERRAVAEAIYGLIRMRRRIAFAIGSDAPERVPAQVLLDAWLALYHPELKTDGEDPRFRDLDGRIRDLPDEVERLAVRHSYPNWIVERLLADLPAIEVGALLSAMNERAPLTARANRLKNTRGELLEALAKEGIEGRGIPIAPDAVEIVTHTNAYDLKAFREGRFELQDAASQLVAELVAPPPRSLVVDACAGAGGKTLALGASMKNQGRLVALDIYDDKIDELKHRARRAGLTNIRTKVIDANDPRATFAALSITGAADRVLVDAPCSGLGVLRRNPEARWRLTPEEADELARKQREILATYAPLVAPGGRLIYATCTVVSTENDAVVRDFLAAHPDFIVMTAKEILGADRAAEIGDGTFLRCYPHRHGTDGFFGAVLRRKAA